jgi:hypothetical protein
MNQKQAVGAILAIASSIEPAARLGHYGLTSQERAWFDDLRLEEVP